MRPRRRNSSSNASAAKAPGAPLAIASVGGVGEAPLPVVALFVLVAFLNSFLGHGAYALLLSSAPVRGAYVRTRRWIEAGLGCFFLFASVKLATARI